LALFIYDRSTSCPHAHAYASAHTHAAQAISSHPATRSQSGDCGTHLSALHHASTRSLNRIDSPGAANGPGVRCSEARLGVGLRSGVGESRQSPDCRADSASLAPEMLPDGPSSLSL
uniref:Pecanex-like protein n=1 Tax=Anisakis simplex TaxID=6269 RepID=A0A0M3J655_ANISI